MSENSKNVNVSMGLNTQDIENIGQALFQIADSLNNHDKGWDKMRNIVDGLDNIASGLFAVAKAIDKDND